MRFRIATILTVVAMACSDGGFIVEGNGDNPIFSGLTEADVIKYIQLSKLSFTPPKNGSNNFATINSCDSRNFLRINESEFTLFRPLSILNSNGSVDFFAMDISEKYILIVTPMVIENRKYLKLFEGGYIALYEVNHIQGDLFDVTFVNRVDSSSQTESEICFSSNGVSLSLRNGYFYKDYPHPIAFTFNANWPPRQIDSQ